MAICKLVASDEGFVTGNQCEGKIALKVITLGRGGRAERVAPFHVTVCSKIPRLEMTPLSSPDDNGLLFILFVFFFRICEVPLFRELGNHRLDGFLGSRSQAVLITYRFRFEV